MADFTLRQNDTTSVISSVLTDDTGAPVSLASASVKFRLADITTGTLKVDAIADIAVDPTTGSVSYAWMAADTDTAGLFLAEWRVTFLDDSIETFPNTGFITVQITPALTVAADTDTSLYVTVEDMKNSLSLSGQTYADEDLRIGIAAACRAIDQACGRWFYSADEIRYFTGDPNDLTLFVDDIVSVTTVEVDTGNNGLFETAWTKDSDFYLEPYNASLTGKPYDRIRIVPRSGRVFPYCERNVKITGTFGWAAVPAEVIQFAKIFASKLMLRSRQAPFGVLSYGMDQPIAVRISRHDPDFERLLGHLVKVRMFL